MRVCMCRRGASRDLSPVSLPLCLSVRLSLSTPLLLLLPLHPLPQYFLSPTPFPFCLSLCLSVSLCVSSSRPPLSPPPFTFSFSFSFSFPFPFSTPFSTPFLSPAGMLCCGGKGAFSVQKPTNPTQRNNSLRPSPSPGISPPPPPPPSPPRSPSPSPSPSPSCPSAGMLCCGGKGLGCV
eukprot:COSAG02_NODE_512_length_20850_cov_4.993302_9_plen_179_part_00